MMSKRYWVEELIGINEFDGEWMSFCEADNIDEANEIYVNRLTRYPDSAVRIFDTEENSVIRKNYD